LVPLEMSTIDIEAPGASEAALKAAIQALIPISTTTISSPVNYVDITLPSGYSAFRLIIVGLVGSEAYPFAAFSQDGGGTFLEDFDGSYVSHTLSRIVLATSFATAVEDSGAIDVAQSETGMPNCCDILIDPGSASRLAHLQIVASGTSVNITTPSPGLSVLGVTCRINTARVNAIRFVSGENPGAPTPANTFSSGTFTLYGVL
jgi:hypothetical protein